ncbi:PhnB protein [Fontibacillus phaseoli]|uniref:PhnB protein n=1 Tax=Fontibacillus phaseoli TaxID=1416533 RepID=A0A369BBA0_9BACL|nr:VOC family protein [Fontibacillus phaseoli]RCX16944.1 PhnB protein [Fontibacillus phaseoli]
MAVQLTPYLTMNGNAKEAIQFYQQALEAEVLFIQNFEEMPENPEFPLPAEMKDRVSHATLKIGESVLMFSDSFPGQASQNGNLLSICITTDSPEQAGQYFEALKQGGKVEMPLQETFFSPNYGIVADKFGVVFQVFTQGPH